MSYSKKIDNVIEDLGLDLPILHFHKTDKNMIIDLSHLKQFIFILDRRKKYEDQE